MAYAMILRFNKQDKTRLGIFLFFYYWWITKIKSLMSFLLSHSPSGRSNTAIILPKFNFIQATRLDYKERLFINMIIDICTSDYISSA